MENQIAGILTQDDAGLPLEKICAEHGVSKALYCQWKSMYVGVSVNELQRVRELDSENSPLQKVSTKLAWENTAIGDLLSREL